MSKSSSNPGLFSSKNQWSSPLPPYVFSSGKMKRFGEMTSKDALNSKIHRLWRRAHPHPKVVDVIEYKVVSLFQTGCYRAAYMKDGKLVSRASIFILPQSKKGRRDGSCPRFLMPRGIKFIIWFGRFCCWLVSATPSELVTFYRQGSWGVILQGKLLHRHPGGPAQAQEGCWPEVTQIVIQFIDPHS